MSDNQERDNRQDRQRKVRWRLVLGQEAEGMTCQLEGQDTERDQALEYLYKREYGPDRNVRRDGQGTQGGMGESQLTIPDWINAVHELFPQRTIERIEKDALERYHMEEMVTNPELLSRAEPSPTLLKAILRTKHLMNQQVLGLARDLVRKTVEQLMEKLAADIRTPFIGRMNRQQRSFIKVAKNFDPETTIRRNLANFDLKTQRIYIRTPYFNSRIRRLAERWQIIILLDESGSMVDNVIHGAIMASVFWGIKSLRTHLCIFDTSVVDLTEDCVDPVETLMKVQLGGGTDIGGALAYAQKIIDQPRRTIVVMVTDFYEGAPKEHLLHVAKELIGSGVTLIGLAALDSQAKPNYDRDLAESLVRLGAHVAAMTPGELALWIAEKVR